MTKIHALVLTLAVSSIGSMGSGLAAAPTLITACPTKITATGFYAVRTQLTASGTCITIAAKNVTLALDAPIGGNHTGAGILIGKAATGAVIRGTGPVGVSSFKIGIEDDAGAAIIGDLVTNANAQTGLLLNGASAIATLVDDFAASSNGHDGIRVTSPAGARLNSFSTLSNGVYGIWLDAASSGSVLSNFQASDNTRTNVEVAGNANVVRFCTEYGGQYGIVIEKNAGNNLVGYCGAQGNTAPSVVEALDKNAECGTDRWGKNFFITSKPRCIKRPSGLVAVTTCQTIATAGNYYLSANLVGAGEDCLVINAINVTLDFRRHRITGNRAGIGLHVMAGATGFQAYGNGRIDRFQTGVVVEADGAYVEEISVDHSIDTGILVNAAKGATLGLNDVTNNRHHGYHLLNASNTLIHNYSANKNGHYGVFVQTSTGTLLNQFEAGDNGANGVAGVYIGCSPNGPRGSCRSSPSPRNVVSHGSTSNNAKYGLVVDRGSNQNVLANVPAGGNAIDDFFDGNRNCAKNLWFFDSFTTSNNASCMNE